MVIIAGIMLLFVAIFVILVRAFHVLEIENTLVEGSKPWVTYFGWATFFQGAAISTFIWSLVFIIIIVI